ncbi:hypothetical protein CW745_13600 [Psychromonas sp. psych-6C06]|nr:hypothetical protein CW745_13600 [Psychromonas sp. psych-6C06]
MNNAVIAIMIIDANIAIVFQAQNAIATEVNKHVLKRFIWVLSQKKVNSGYFLDGYEIAT